MADCKPVEPSPCQSKENFPQLRMTSCSTCPISTFESYRTEFGRTLRMKEQSKVTLIFGFRALLVLTQFFLLWGVLSQTLSISNLALVCEHLCLCLGTDQVFFWRQGSERSTMNHHMWTEPLHTRRDAIGNTTKH
eukprot:5383780-Amphidinium_carterae.1